MGDPGIDAWQIPIIVTAAVVLLEGLVNGVLSRHLDLVTHRRVRTALLGLLLGLTVVVFVFALGPSLADELSSVAAAVAAVVALWLTYRSYQSAQEARTARDAPPPEPEPVAAPPAPPTPPAPLPRSRKRWSRR